MSMDFLNNMSVNLSYYFVLLRHLDIGIYRSLSTDQYEFIYSGHSS